MSQQENLAFTNEAHVMLLQMQVEELQSALDKEQEMHRKASKRATAAEQRNKKLREAAEDMEGDLNILAQCMSCPDWGHREKCKGCTNSAVFQWNGTSFEWRGLDKHNRR